MTGELPESLSPLFAALRACDVRLVEQLAARPDVSLDTSMPAHDAWSWAATCAQDVLERFLELYPEAADRRDADGARVLHAVVEDARHPDKTALLLEHPGVDADAQQSDGTTPLYRAALAGNLAAARLLLARSVDVNNRNSDNGWTVLMVVAAEDHPEIAAELLAQPTIDVNARDESGATALHIAAEYGHERVAALLAGHPGTDVNAKDDLGRTPLSVAAFEGHLAIVERLLAHPAVEVDLVDRDRQTALHWAALAGHLDVVERLLADPRTNPGITNRPEGSTARDLAQGAAHDRVAAVLAERMRCDPGSDDLAPGDEWQEPPEPPPPFFHKPLIPHPPRGHRGRP